MMYMGNLGRTAKLESMVTEAEMDEVGHVARVLCALQKSFTYVLEVIGSSANGHETKK